MLLPSDLSSAMLLALAAMLFWGSWPNAHKLTPGRRFELFYQDYVFGLLLCAAAMALLAGRGHGHPDFLENLAAAGPSAWGVALLAGAFLNAGNLLLMAGVVLVGIAVAFPVAVGLSLVLGTVASYLIMPRGNPALIAAGVALVFAAVVVNSLAYRSLESERGSGSRKGFWLSVLAGVLLAASGPLVARTFAMTPPLSPYGAGLLFASGSLAGNVPLMVLFFRRPVAGPALTVSHYLRGSAPDHLAGLLGGVTWGLGMICAFLSASVLGMALAGAIGQANPLVAALWGVLVWHEFRGAPQRSRALLALMFVLYGAGLLVLGWSY